jgi:hypothetical protein
MVPCRANHRISGTMQIATAEMMLPSYSPELFDTIRLSAP